MEDIDGRGARKGGEGRCGPLSDWDALGRCAESRTFHYKQARPEINGNRRG